MIEILDFVYFVVGPSNGIHVAVPSLARCVRCAGGGITDLSLQRLGPDEILNLPFHPLEDDVVPESNPEEDHDADHHDQVEGPADAEGRQDELDAARENYHYHQAEPEQLPKHRLGLAELVPPVVQVGEVNHPQREQNRDDLYADHDSLHKSILKNILSPSNTVVPLYLSW